MLPNPRLFFVHLPDPRRETRNKLHKIEDMVMITLCAVLGGFEDWVSIEDFGHANETWLRGFLELPNGFPSHDTLSDVIARIDRDAFATAFVKWVRAGCPRWPNNRLPSTAKVCEVVAATAAWCMSSAPSRRSHHRCHGMPEKRG